MLWIWHSMLERWRSRKLTRPLLPLLRPRCILLPNEPIVSPEATPAPSQQRHVLDPPALAAERPPLSLWGLTLGMSLDLLSNMPLPESSEIRQTIAADRLYGNESDPASSSSSTTAYFSQNQHGDTRLPFDLVLPRTPHNSFPPLLAPSMTSIFPTFSYPDVNLFIWLFGFRYRHLVQRWNDRLKYQMERYSSSASGDRAAEPDILAGSSSSSTRRPNLARRGSSIPGTPGGSLLNPHAGRVNFAGMALNQFYAAVRKALIVAVVLRAIVALGGISAATLWLVRRVQRLRQSRRPPRLA